MACTEEVNTYVPAKLEQWNSGDDAYMDLGGREIPLDDADCDKDYELPNSENPIQ